MSNSNKFTEYLRQMDNWKKKILSSIWPKIPLRIELAWSDISPLKRDKRQEKPVALKTLADFMDSEGGVLLSEKTSSLSVEHRFIAEDADEQLSNIENVKYNEYFQSVRNQENALVWRGEVYGKPLNLGNAQVRCIMTTFLDEKVSELLSLGPQPFFVSVLNAYASKEVSHRRIMPRTYWPSPSEVEFAALVPVVLFASGDPETLLEEYFLQEKYNAAKTMGNLNKVHICLKSLIDFNRDHFHCLGTNAYLRDLINFLIQWVTKHPGRARQIIDIVDDCRSYFEYAINRRSAASVLAKAYFFLSRIPVAGAYKAGQHYLSLSLKE